MCEHLRGKQDFPHKPSPGCESLITLVPFTKVSVSSFRPGERTIAKSEKIRYKEGKHRFSALLSVLSLSVLLVPTRMETFILPNKYTCVRLSPWRPTFFRFDERGRRALHVIFRVKGVS